MNQSYFLLSNNLATEPSMRPNLKSLILGSIQEFYGRVIKFTTVWSCPFSTNGRVTGCPDPSSGSLQ